MGIIYLISCMVSGKIYVGQTILTLEERWEGHKHKARQMIYHQNIHDNLLQKQGILHSHLYKAMAKYGIEQFKIEMLEECDDTDLDEKETYWIEELDSLSPKGYNLMTGGGSNQQHSKVTKMRISQTRIANIDTNRNPKLNGLPPYTTYRNHPERGEYFRVNKHPLCKSKTFSVKTYGSLEVAKEALVKFVDNLVDDQKQHAKNKIGGAEFVNMPGFCKTKDGYRVNVVRKGKNYDRKFKSKNKTDEENKNSAIEYYNGLMEDLSQ